MLAIWLLPSFAIGWILYQRYVLPRRSPLWLVKGPEPSNWLLGSLRDVFGGVPGAKSISYMQEFGGLVAYRGLFHKPGLIISDPAALRHILSTDVYAFTKPDALVKGPLKSLFGNGLLFAEGDDHIRQRRIMIPAFSPTVVQALTGTFFALARELRTIWTQEVQASDGPCVINVAPPIARLTLDIIGEAALGEQFQTLERNDHALAATFGKMFSAPVPQDAKPKPGLPGRIKHTATGILRLAAQIFPTLANLLPASDFTRAFGVIDDESRKIVERRQQAILDPGNDRKDLLSLLMKSNMDETTKARMSDAEVRDQIKTVLLAGHETGATALDWTLHRLALHPEMQTRLRDEVRSAFKASRDRGEDELPQRELNALPFLDALLREMLRVLPPVAGTVRQCQRESVMPLSRPYTLRDGREVDSITVPKGASVFISIASANMLPELFGEDAAEFRPERWLDGSLKDTREITAGWSIYSSLLTFIGGTRACIGYKFAILEIKAILAVLIDAFVFEEREPGLEIRPTAGITTRPVVATETERGPQLPLRVSIAP